MTRFLFRNMKGRRGLLCVAILLTFIQVACAILAAFPLKYILDKIVHHRDPVIPMFNGLLNAFDHFGSRNGLSETERHTQLGVILFSVAMVIVLEVAGAAASYAQELIATFVGQELGAKLRQKAFVHLEHLSVGWHNRQRTGEIVQRITGNVADIEKLVTDGLVDLLSGVLTLFGVILVMILLNWQFTVLSLLALPLMGVIVACYTRWIKRASKKRSRASGEVSQVATEVFNAVPELKVFSLERWAAGSFHNKVEEQRVSGTRAGRRQAEFDPMVQLLTSVSYVIILSAGCWIAAGHGHRFQALFLAIPTGSLTIGTLTVFLAYSKQLYQPMRNLSKLVLVASNASSAAERIQEILDQPVEATAPPESYTWAAAVKGDIAYRNVEFAYDEGQPVLRGIDLDVPAGRRIALVGLSGSGKTTLVRLLPRFYDACAGSITIDGRDVRDYPLDILRSNISLVLQDSVLFEGTIRDNIALGRPHATDDRIADAARQACIYDTIMALPDGFESQVREQGKNFSSGQRQRLAIARAILRDAPILILDEPTANLDVEAEGEVMRAIERLTAGRTVIVVSHRLSTLGKVDEIVVLEAGRIIERGTYAELKVAGGAFARLLGEQNKYAAEPILLEPPRDAHDEPKRNSGRRRPAMPNAANGANGEGPVGANGRANGDADPQANRGANARVTENGNGNGNGNGTGTGNGAKGTRNRARGTSKNQVPTSPSDPASDAAPVGVVSAEGDG